jgi:LPXTG-motif cell wall-anchored protein
MTAASALQGLRDVHLPPPPAAAAYAGDAVLAVALLGLLALLAGAWLLVRRRRRQRPWRSALRALAEAQRLHAADGDDRRLLVTTGGLLRRYAAHRYPGAGVPGLCGEAWLEFLERHGGDGAFAKGAGAALAGEAYRPQAHVAGAALAGVARHWLRRNRP